MKLTKSIIAIALMATTLTAWAQDDIKNTEFNPVTTGVTSLSRMISCMWRRMSPTSSSVTGRPICRST